MARRITTTLAPRTPAAAPGSGPPIALVRLTDRRILAPEAADTGRSTPT